MSGSDGLQYASPAPVLALSLAPWAASQWASAILLAALANTSAWGQSISAADERRAATAQPQITDADIDRARRQHAPPAVVPPAIAPRIDALPQPASPASIDLERIAQGLATTGASNPPFPQDGPRLLIFVSLSMPVPTLQRLIDQAARAQAVLLLRGLDQSSLVKTVARARQLIGTRRVDLQIDPEAFDRYQVNLVPSFVLTAGNPSPRGCTTTTCQPRHEHLKLAGDVSLDHALSMFTRSSSVHRDAAAAYLKRMGP